MYQFLLNLIGTLLIFIIVLLHKKISLCHVKIVINTVKIFKNMFNLICFINNLKGTIRVISFRYQDKIDNK